MSTPTKQESSATEQIAETQVMESVTDENKDQSNLEALISYEDERAMRFDAQPFILPNDCDEEKPQPDQTTGEKSDLVKEATEELSAETLAKREKEEKLSKQIKVMKAQH